jgi:outer membrane lipase/esterase
MISKSGKIFLVSALSTLTMFGTLRTATASDGYSQFVGFGDSTMDSGYFRYSPTGGSPSLPPGAPVNAMDIKIANAVAAGASGAFLGPGVVDTIQIAEKFGLTANPVTMPGGGTNYANGSAQTYATTQDNGFTHGLYNNVPVTAQIANYLNSVNGHANSDALYMISVGGNDLAWLDENPAVSPTSYIRSLSDALSAGIVDLHAAGARNIMVLNAYSYSRVVQANGYVAPADAENVKQSALYASYLWSSLRNAGVNFIPVDDENVLRYVSQNPTMFGFTPASVLTANPACGAISGLICTPADLVSPDAQQTHLWGDPKHLSSAGQTIVADYMYALLTAPINISLIAETAIQSGLSRTATIQRQLELSGQHRGMTKINGWMAAGYEYSKTEPESYFPSASGNPFHGTVGADYLTGSGLILGGALTAGTQSQDFSSGGDFDQDEQTINLYSAYNYNQFWGNIVTSYGILQNDISRFVKFGIFTDQNSGDADGNSFSLAVRGGSDIKIDRLTTGPIFGVIFQEADIDGFIEHGTTGVTSLSFESQTRKSQVTQLGWRGSVELSAWKPFVEATWNHEWNDDDRTVTTTLTTVSAPSYTTLATSVDSDWGNATIGASYRINPNTILWGAFSEVFGNSEMTNYGGEVGLSISF